MRRDDVVDEKQESPGAQSPLKKAYLKLEELRSRLEAAETARREPIAVIGMACRLPGGVMDPEGYWELLRDGRDAVTEIPPDRWDVEGLFDPSPEAPGKMYTRWGGFLDRVGDFDAQFFGISPREAVNTDPQQRLLLEVTWEALEHSGIAPDGLAGSRTGVFTGIGFNDYARLLADLDRSFLNGYSGSGAQLCFATGRVSYVLGLRGPSMPVDTACSSSLVALHQACQSLRAGECDLALAGGVNLLLAPDGNIFLSKAGALSPTGRCRTFDDSADGFVRGEGCGVVVLERLSRAVANRRSILAVIRGSAVNHDGRSSGLTVPNGPAQEAVIRAALDAAGLTPDDVGVVEAHGTGTPLGDPIEMRSLKAVFGRREGRQPLVVGSVKTNFGHIESASGVASVIKAVLMLDRQEVPPHLHFEKLSSHIAADEPRVEIPTRPRPWPRREDRRRIVGVSSFGLSGTNAHVLFEEAPAAVEEPAESAEGEPGAGPPWLLPLSARRPEALAELADRFRALLETGGEDLPAIAATAALGRAHHDHRLAVVASSKEEAAQALAEHAAGRRTPAVAAGRRPLAGEPEVVFVFSGQGAQWEGMGRDLLAREKAFRDTFERCDAACRKLGGFSLIDEMAASGERSRIDETEVAQPLLFAFQVALSELWRSRGIEPAAVVGHSLGEIAAACVAGAFELEAALSLAVERGRLMQRLTGGGGMAAVSVDRGEGQRLVEGREERLAVAAVNAPRSIVLSGEPEALDEVLGELATRQVLVRRLPVSYAFHSPQTAPLEGELVEALAGLEPRATTVPLVSAVTGRRHPGEELGPAYWGENMTRPVEFAAAIETLIDEGHRHFLEIGPHGVLAPPVAQVLAARGVEGRVVVSQRRDEDSPTVFAQALAQLFAAGCAVDWRQVCRRPQRPAALPTYPWQRQRYWFDADPAATRTRRGGDPVLGVELENMATAPKSRVWELDLIADRPLPFTGVHRRGQTPVVPLSAFAELASEAARRVFGDGGVSLTGLDLHEPLPLPASGGRVLQLSLTPSARGGQARVLVHSRPLEGNGAGAHWVLHASAEVEASGAPSTHGESKERSQDVS